jgi:hypothetical protein
MNEENNFLDIWAFDDKEPMFEREDTDFFTDLQPPMIDRDSEFDFPNNVDFPSLFDENLKNADSDNCCKFENEESSREVKVETMMVDLLIKSLDFCEAYELYPLLNRKQPQELSENFVGTKSEGIEERDENDASTPSDGSTSKDVSSKDSSSQEEEQ